MKTVINLILMLMVIGLFYVLWQSINEPIEFKEEWTAREDAVRDQLIDIREAQKAYKGIVGKYAHNFDTLAEVLTTGEFTITTLFGDPDDPTGGAVRKETSIVKAIDSINTLGINLETLRYIPFTDNEEFDIEARVIDYQKTQVPVVLVSTPITKYMGKFSDQKYTRYDSNYDPSGSLRFGDLSKPSLAGNWRVKSSKEAD